MSGWHGVRTCSKNSQHRNSLQSKAVLMMKKSLRLMMLRLIQILMKYAEQTFDDPLATEIGYLKAIHGKIIYAKSQKGKVV